MANRLPRFLYRPLHSQQGQGSPEYLGVITAAALVVVAIVMVAPGLGASMGQKLECMVATVLGGECESDSYDERCPISNSTSTDSLSAGISIKAISGGGSLERVIIKEQFDDGSATYTVIDRAELEAALGSRGGGARFLGSQGSLTAGLAAFGALEDAEIYETENQEQTDAIDDRLEDPGFVENIIRSGGSIGDTVVDAPVDIGCTVISFGPVDCPDVRPSDITPNPSELFADAVFGDQDLPDPDSEYVSGETGVSAFAEAIQDSGGAGSGPDEAGGETELIAAGGGRVFTDGDREGETELYYRLEGNVQAGLEDALLGTINGSADGELIATVVIGADGRPSALRLNATGTVTGEENLGEGELVDSDDLSELLADADSGSGKTYEVVAELDLTDPDNLERALGLLSVDPSTQADGLDGLIDAYRDDSEIRVATYDTESESTESGIDIVVANVEGSSSEQTNTLESLWIKPEGSLVLSRTPCGTSMGE